MSEEGIGYIHHGEKIVKKVSYDTKCRIGW